MSGRFSGKVILVTGAASGIGRGTALRLGEEGAVVHACDVATVAPGAGLVTHQLDVTREDQWQSVMAEIAARDGRLDGLVNAAGIIRMGATSEQSIEDFRLVMAVNVEGTFLGCKHALKAMQPVGRGSIVNVSSSAGLVGSPGAAAYCASKAAVTLLTKSIALEAIALPSRIRINSLHPALTNTPMVDSIVKQLGGAEEVRNALSGLLPSGRLAEIDEIVAAILFLLSDEASYVNGSAMTVDNGFTAQ